MLSSAQVRRLALLCVPLVLGIAAAWWYLVPEGPRSDGTAIPAEPDADDEGASPSLRGVAAPDTQAPARGDAGAPSSVAPAATGAWKLTFETSDAEGAAVPWTSAMLYDKDGKPLRELPPPQESTTRGEVELVGGAYLVVGAFRRVPWCSPWLEPPPSGTRHVEVAFEAGLTVTGTVFEQDGTTPLTSGTVKAWTLPTPDGWRPPVSARMALVGKDGRFRVEGLPAGPVRLMAEAYEFVKGRKARLDAEAGDQDLRIVLAPQGAVSFVITDAATGLEPKSTSGRLFEVAGDGEHVRTMWGRPPSFEPTEAKRLGWLRAEPGETYRYRVRVQGFEPSEVIEVTIPETGGARVIPVAVRAAPERVARLNVTVRMASGPLPDGLYVRHNLGKGSANHTWVTLENGRFSLELMPGTHDLEVGRAFKPEPGRASSFLVPAALRLELSPGEVYDRVVTLERGGWVLIEGEPDPQPRKVLLKRGGEVIERFTGWSMWGKDNQTAYMLGTLPVGTWTLEYTRRGRGVRTTFEVTRGTVTRLDPADFASFVPAGR